MEDICYYIGGFVVKKLLKRVDFQFCKNTLTKPGNNDEKKK